MLKYKKIIMLKHTFTILPGVGTRFERHLWREGVFTWEDFLTRIHIPGVSQSRKNIFDREITKALHAQEKGDIDYFTGRLHHSEYWRLFDAFHKDAICLDIETMGGPSGDGEVTIVGMYGRDQMHTLIKDINLDSGTLKDILFQYKLIITYYGRVFDIPFLHKSISGLKVDMPNYDLCFAARRLNIKGGLKKVEAYFGMRREDSITGMNGYDAVKLWGKYIEGDEDALKILLKYNEADTKNLYQLAEVLSMMLSREYGPENINR